MEGRGLVFSLRDSGSFLVFENRTRRLKDERQD
jgi:hypothetical protein